MKGSDLNSIAELLDQIEDNVAPDDDPNLDDLAPLWITSEPGLGKTALVGQLCERHDWGLVQAQFEENVDLTGIPDISGERTAFMKPELFHQVEELAKTKEVVLLYIDEAAKIRSDAHKNFYTLLNEKQVAPHTQLPDNVKLILTSNLMEHGAISDQEIPPAVLNRIGFHNFTGPTPEEWLSYAASASVHPVVTSFLAENGDKLIQFDPNSDELDATPRSWSNLGRSLAKKEKRWAKNDKEITALTVETEAMAYLPKSIAKELVAHFAFENEIPKLKDIAQDPENTEMPKNISAGFYLSYRMAFALNEDNAASFRSFMEKSENIEVKSTFDKAVDKMGKADMLADAVSDLSKEEKEKAHENIMDTVIGTTTRSTRR